VKHADSVLSGEIDMKKFAVVLSALAVLVCANIVRGQMNDERAAVRQAVLDYVEGVYNVDPARIEKSVHPELAKRGFYRARGKEGYSEGKMTHAQLIEVAKTWNKAGKLRPDAPKEITIFEVTDQTASAKLVAEWGMDYFHLAKYDGKWLIVNVLWQSLPEKKVAAGRD
jgi:hypothetical protein